MKSLGLENKDDEPQNIHPDRKYFFDKIADDVMDNFCFLFKSPEEILGKVAPPLPQDPPQCEAVTDHYYVKHSNTPQKYFCCHPLCDESFHSVTMMTRHEAKCPFKGTSSKYSLHELEPQVKKVKTPKALEEEDQKFNYVSRLLRYGLLDMIRTDATREGNGQMIYALWKNDFLLFKTGNHTNYAILGFTLVAQVKAVLSEREAFQLIHNRFVNYHGGQGSNISSDLALEHLNKEVKPVLSTKVANLTPKVFERTGKSLKVLRDVVKSFDAEAKFYSSVGCHERSTYESEVADMCKELKGEDLLSVIPGRSYVHFPEVERFPEYQVDGRDLRKWIFHKKMKMHHAELARANYLDE